MDSTSRRTQNGASPLVEAIPLYSDEEASLNEPVDAEQHENELLPLHHPASQDGHAAPNPSHFLRFPLRISQAHMIVLALVVFGTFLATCPLPRAYLSRGYPIRQILITFVASLVTSPPLRGARIFSQPKRIRRVFVSYLGLYLSVYAIFGAADGVHIEMPWHSLLWYHIQGGYRLGPLVRLSLLAAGYFTQKSAGIHSRVRILGTYLLCLVWIYADVPMTIFDLARGREHW